MTSTNSLTVFIVDDGARNAYSDAYLSKAGRCDSESLGDLPRTLLSRIQPRVVEHDRHRREVRGHVLRASGCGAAGMNQSVVCCSCAFPLK